MLINTFPHFVYKENKQYQLDLSYRKTINSNGNFVWTVVYVGDDGILYREENINTDILYTNFIKYCNNNNIIINPTDILPITVLGDGVYTGTIVGHNFTYNGNNYFSYIGVKSIIPMQYTIHVQNGKEVIL